MNHMGVDGELLTILGLDSLAGFIRCKTASLEEEVRLERQALARMEARSNPKEIENSMVCKSAFPRGLEWSIAPWNAKDAENQTDKKWPSLVEYEKARKGRLPCPEGYERIMRVCEPSYEFNIDEHRYLIGTLLDDLPEY